MNSLRIFVVDDERIIRVSLADELRDAGYQVFEFADPIMALQQLEVNEPQLIITDLKMPEMNGIELLTKVKKINQDILVVIMTSYATFPVAVKAIKLGAYDFISKPFQPELVLLMLERIKELSKLKSVNYLLGAEISDKFDFTSYIGDSEQTKKVFELVKIVFNKSSTVLITGETGTGKELLTKVIHYNGNRKKQPLIKVNCAVLSREIFESELFGHVKGAFTGAEKEKKGRFELADGGTLYLDDVDDIPIDLQVKLLRALEEREIEKVGGTETIKIDVRVIASTKKNLKSLVEEGKFREDLFYRLNVFPIHLMPLRERPNDVTILFNHFVKQFSEGREIKTEEQVIRVLTKYRWPGNIRELKNIAERLTLLAKNEIISFSLLPTEIIRPTTDCLVNCLGDKSLADIVNEFEANALKLALSKFGGNKTKAAKFLDIPPSTLRTKMDKHKLN